MTVHQASAHLKRVVERPLVKVEKCRHGTMMYFPHDIYIGGALEKYGEYIEEETNLLLEIAQPGDIVVEVGANIGCDTIPLAQRVTHSGRVLAFEPQRIIFNMLCGNLALNAAWNVVAERAALTDKVEPGQLLYVPPVNYAEAGNFGGVSMVDAGGEPVQVLTLDAYNLGRCNLIKVDVEGMEEQVLRGAAQTIKKFKPVLYVENDREDKDLSLVAYIRSLGYVPHWHIARMFSADNFRGDPENIYQEGGLPISAINMLCLPVGGPISTPLPEVTGPVQIYRKPAAV